MISHAIYLDVNRKQSRSANFRLFDDAVSAGAGAFTSTTYIGRGTLGQVADAAVVTSSNYIVWWGYEAGSQAIPLIVPGHDDYNFINGVFASGTGATTLTSTHFIMLGTLGEVGLPTNTTTLASASFSHQPGFLAAAPSVRPQVYPTQTIGPQPLAEPALACETPYVSINGDAAFTNSPTVALYLCAPRAAEMMVSNDATLSDAVWEPFTITKTWVLSITGPQTSARFVYAVFKEDNGTLHETYFDDIIYDTGVPTFTVMLEDGIPVTVTQFPTDGLDMSAVNLAPVTGPLAVNASGAITLYIGGLDDNSGIAEMQLSDNITFAGATWEPFAPVKLYIPAEEGLQTVYARVRDGAGNVSPVSQKTFVYDAQPPEGGLTFDQIAVSSDAITSTVYLYAWDEWTDVTDMRVGFTPLLTDTFWQPYTWTLELPISITAQSQYTLYVQYRDSVGHISQVYSDTLYVDSDPPIVYVDVAPGDTLTRTVDIYAYDDLSGIANRYLSNDPLMLEGVITLPYTSTIMWNFDENRIVWVQVEDGVGNLSEPYPAYARKQQYNVYLPVVMK